MVYQQPMRYRDLAFQLQQPQQQQQQQMPNIPTGMINQFMGGDGGGFGGFGGGGSGGGGGSSSLSAVASNPYTWLAAALAAKAVDTKDKGGVSYSDQLKNISKAPITDYERLEENYDMDKIAPFGGGELYKSTFELASGDFSNWWDRHKKAFKEIF